MQGSRKNQNFSLLEKCQGSHVTQTHKKYIHTVYVWECECVCVFAFLWIQN